MGPREATVGSQRGHGWVPERPRWCYSGDTVGWDSPDPYHGVALPIDRLPVHPLPGYPTHHCRRPHGTGPSMQCGTVVRQASFGYSEGVKTPVLVENRCLLDTTTDTTTDTTGFPIFPCAKPPVSPCESVPSDAITRKCRKWVNLVIFMKWVEKCLKLCHFRDFHEISWFSSETQP